MARFTWSYSKLKNYETCAFRHKKIDLDKLFVEQVEEGGPLDWGNKVHSALHGRLGELKTPLPPDMQEYEKWAVRVEAGPGTLLVEQKFGITRHLVKSAWMGGTVWFRGIGDFVRIHGSVALVGDWKTGKVVEDSVQLGLMAQCIFSHYPEVQHVRSEFIWLQDDTHTPEVFARADMPAFWAEPFGSHTLSLLERVNMLEQAMISQTYPMKPGGLCKKYCAVSVCPYWKKGALG